MKIKINIKPEFVIKEYGSLRDKGWLLRSLGFTTIGPYGTYMNHGMGDNFGYAYNIERYKRKKYRKEKQVVIRVYKIPFEFLDATKMKIRQYPRYFRLVPR